MACFGGNYRKKSVKMGKGGKLIRGLKEKVRLLQEEVKTIMVEREKDVRAYEREMVLFAFKEAEWKRERKKLEEEARRLRKVAEERDADKARNSNELVVVSGRKSEEFGGNWETVVVDAGRRGFRLENVSGEEGAWRRDEAVDKWKKLYLSIKTELDDLIQIIHRGDYGMYLRAEEEEEKMEELKMEVKAKEETIEELKAKLGVVERTKAREVDILRQSLRIMTSRTMPTTSSLPLCKPRLAPVKVEQGNRHLVK